MKKLCLVRHADTEPPVGAQSDKARRLTPQGELNAEILARKLDHLQVHPDLIVCSDASRAVQTADIIADGLGFSGVQPDAKIYAANETELSDYLMMIDPEIESLLLVGHNPTLSHFAASHSAEITRSMRPANAIGLIYQINAWSEVSPTHCQFLFFVTAD